jgi:hypothetical protein
MVVFYTKGFNILEGFEYPMKKYDEEFLNDLLIRPNLSKYIHSGLVLARYEDYIWTAEAIADSVKLFKRPYNKHMDIKVHAKEDKRYLAQVFSKEWTTLTDWLEILSKNKPINLNHKDGNLFFWRKIQGIRYPNPYYATHLIIDTYEKAGIMLTYNYENKLHYELAMEFINE